MAHIQLAEAQAWLDGTKLRLPPLDAELESQIATEVLGQLSETYSDPTFGTPTWVDYLTTPKLVRQIIAMMYAGWIFDRTYSEVTSGGGVSYGEVLRANAETLILGIVTSSIQLIETFPNDADVAPVFYPTDASSTSDALAENSNPDDMSLGPSLFGVQKIF